MWDWAIWGALIAGALAVAGALALLGVRILQGWRDFKRARRHVFGGLDVLAAKGEATTEKAATAGETGELQRSLLRLRGALAQLAVLREAVDEAQDSFGGLDRVHVAPVIVAGIDLGTNTTRLLVADVEGESLRELRRESRITRLGEGVDRRRRLLPVPIARVRNALSDYRRTAEALGAERILLVATSAVRDAENGEAFLGEIEWGYGFATRLLSGDEEALLTRRGVGADGAGHADPRRRRRLDGADLSTTSTRASTRAPSVSPSGHGEEVERCRHELRALLPELEAGNAVGVAATVTTLAALDLGLDRYDRERVHGHRLTLEGARAQLERLAALTLEERRLVPALEPERAPVIVAGAAIVVAVLERYGLDALRSASATSSTAPPSPPPSCRSPRRARRRRAPTPAAEAGSRLSASEDDGARVRVRRLVLCEAPPHDRAREDADEASALLHDRHPLEVLLLEEVEPGVELERGVERVVRRLGDLAQRDAGRIEAPRHHLAYQGLARDDAEQAAVVLGDEDRADVRSVGEAPSGVLRARAGGERRRLGHHRVADGLFAHDGHSRRYG